MAQAGSAPPKFTSIRELFLFKRRPKLNVSAEWQKPEVPAKFDEEIAKSDFIVESELDKDTLQSTIIAQNIRDLKDFLLTNFFEANQQAKHFQNLYFRNQWILIFGSSITAIVATISIFLSTNVVPPTTNAGTNSTPVPTIVATSQPVPTIETTSEPVPTIATTSQPASSQSGTTTSETDSDKGTRTDITWSSIITAIIASILGIFTALNQKGQPQAQWYKMRKIAEELRHHYFLYLMHLPPYDRDDRVEILEDNGVIIKQNGKSKEAGEPDKTQPLPLNLDDKALQKVAPH